MIPKRLLRSFSLPPFSSRCDLHNFARISETISNEETGKHMKVKGWVSALRKMKNNIFIDINDGSSSEFLQVVTPKSDKLCNLTCGSSVVVEGTLATAPNGRMELRANDVLVIGTCDVNDQYPFLPRKQYSPDYVRQYLHLRPRTKSFSALLRLRDIASTAVVDHFRARNFISVHTPILTSNDCEGAGEVFKVQPDSVELLKSMEKDSIPHEEAFFNTKAYLTVSGQLHLEALARALSKVYCFGPTFRAENSKSRLHLSEFYMLEAEAAFITEIEDIAKEAELLVKSLTTALLDKGSKDFSVIGASEPEWLNKSFTYMTYDEAVNILQHNEKLFTHPIKYGDAFSKEHELLLVRHNNEIPLFVINWPSQIKPFYMREYPNDPSKVAAMDLLAPHVGELVGGSVREENYAKLHSKLPIGLNLEWYLELRKYGNVPTAGFGMGFERFLQCVLGVPNIKDVIPFPRWPHNCGHRRFPTPCSTIGVVSSLQIFEDIVLEMRCDSKCPQVTFFSVLPKNN